ncbi:Reverse transcriptase domain-containing protein [Aphis craccivora]|uniref:Reverse transcriptase domain-containing protein n=1 Tax=Aphis craccivora TaxID=307492 RepID=A0A6G0Y995_APHCR|nr:Reverse transcriptase domain-containing protein [Aphis craccivora]
MIEKQSANQEVCFQLVGEFSASLSQPGKSTGIEVATVKLTLIITIVWNLEINFINNKFGEKMHSADKSKEISNYLNEYFTNSAQNMYNQIKLTRQYIHNIEYTYTEQLTSNTTDISFNKFSVPRPSTEC